MKAMKSKVKSSGKGGFAAGGGGKMSGPNNAGPQSPMAASAGGAKKANPFIKGGGGKMAGFSPAGKAKMK